MASSLTVSSVSVQSDGRSILVGISGIVTGPLSPPQPGGFTVNVNGAGIYLFLGTASATSVLLYSSVFINHSDVVTVAINASNLVDASGTVIGNYTNIPVINNSAGTGADYIQAVGVPPPVTSAAFDTWALKWLNYRLNECPISRPTNYYFALSGNDTTGSGTIGNPWKSMAKANAVLQSSSGNIGLLFKGEMRPKEVVTVIAQIIATTINSITVDPHFNPSAPMVGTTVTLSGNSNETLTVSSCYNAGATLVIQFSSNIASTNPTTVSYTTLAFINIMQPNITISTWPAGSGGSDHKVAFSCFEGYFSVNANRNNASALRPGGSGATGWTVSTTGGVITSCTGGAGGTGFDPISPPIVTVSDGTGALLKSVVNSSGVVTAVNVIYGGSGYANSSTVTIQGDSYTQTYMYYQPLASPVAALREKNDTTKIFRYMNSVAEVDVTPGSWWQNPTTGYLYYHLHGSRSAGQIGDIYEFLFANSSTAIVVADVHGTRIDNIRIDGYGANLVDDNLRPYAIHGGITSNNACVVSNTECYYNGYHAIGVLSGGFGSIVTYYRCKVGLGTRGGDYVTFSQNGGHESLVWECETNAVGLPRGFVPYTNSYADGGSMISHSGPINFPTAPSIGATSVQHSGGYLVLGSGQKVTLSGGSANEILTISSYNASTYTMTFTTAITIAGHTGLSDPVALNPKIFLVKGCETPYQNQWQSGGFGMPAQSQPYWSDIADCRTWVIGEKIIPHTPTELDLNPFTYTITSQTINSITVPVTSIFGEATIWPLQYQPIRVSGGSSRIETVRVNSVNSSTGVITFVDTLMGQGRNEATWDISLCAGYLVFFAFNATSNTVYRDCHYESRQMAPTGTGDTRFIGGCQNTIFINSTLILDTTMQQSFNNFASNGGLFNSTQANTITELYNCRFHIHSDLGAQLYVDDKCFYGSASKNKIFNTILSADTLNWASGFTPGVGNTSAQQANNAYVNATMKTGVSGYDQDPSYVELGSVNISGHPSFDSPLLSNSPVTVRGRRLEIDADGNLRPLTNTARGPYEAIVVRSGNKNGGSRLTPKGGH